MIAARTALRVLPLVGREYQSDLSSNGDKDQLSLMVYRACLISSAARNYPAEDMTAAAVAAASASNTTTSSAVTPYTVDRAVVAIGAANCAAAAASYIAKTDRMDFGTRANYAASSDKPAALAAADTVRIATNAADAADIWTVVSQDAASLLSLEGQRAEQARQLLGSRLWPDGEPDWARNERLNLEQSHIDNSPHHQVWLTWYNNVLHGKPFFDLSSAREKALTLKIVQQDNDFWEQEFTKVSENIAGWLEEVRIEDQQEVDKLVWNEFIDPDEEEVDQVDFSTNVAEKSELPQSNVSTKLSIPQVDQNLLQIFASVEAIKESAAGRIATRPLKPNSGEALDNWNSEQEFLELVEEKSGQISKSLMAIENHSDRQQAVENTSTLLEELFQEFDSFVRINKKELVDNIVRIPSAIILVGLANLVGASMITATPAIFAMVGGKKVYDLLKKKKAKSD